tara:strand:- start:90 stop:521 length:432 start_codon:yes stop_codon:yes gene_type:complete
MALDGGGGGGGPIGSSNSFTGPAEALELVGPFGYALSGSKEVANAPVEMIKFTSGNYIWKGIVQTGVGGDGAGAESDDIETVLFLNGNKVQARILSHNNESMGDYGIEMIIPPYTEFKALCDNIQGSTTMKCFISLIGEVVRG